MTTTVASPTTTPQPRLDLGDLMNHVQWTWDAPDFFDEVEDSLRLDMEDAHLDGEAPSLQEIWNFVFIQELGRAVRHLAVRYPMPPQSEELHGAVGATACVTAAEARAAYATWAARQRERTQQRVSGVLQESALDEAERACQEAYDYYARLAASTPAEPARVARA